MPLWTLLMMMLLAAVFLASAKRLEQSGKNGWAWATTILGGLCAMGGFVALILRDW